ncbi:MAG: isocitrate lyase/phosphoenolpyruvate mutase family protein [Maribacter sp.]
MAIKKQDKLALDFQQLHHRDKMLILPNVWDVGSARIFESQGFGALATTSAGIAYSKGFADGEKLTIEDMVNATGRIAQRISLPLSVDLEKGYGDSAEEVKNNVRRIIEAGAVGINLEDGNDTADPYLDHLPLVLDKIKALDELKKEMGVPFVINARSCAFWLQIGLEKDRVELAIDRANAFADAGADCIFLPGSISKTTLMILLRDINSPINIIANPTFNNLPEMENMGVKRLSIGSGAVRAALGHTIRVAQELKDYKIDSILGNELTYARANELFGG